MPIKELVIDDLIDLLSERSRDMASEYGGYPGIVEEVAGHIVIADTEHDDEPRLTVYTPEEVAEWLANLNYYFRIDKSGHDNRLLRIRTEDEKPCDPDEDFDFDGVYEYLPEASSTAG